MLGFKSPTPEFLAEMIQANIASERSGIDLSVVPKPVLEQAMHMLLVRVLREKSIDKIDMSVGPNDEYQHEVQGLAITHPDGMGMWAMNPNSEHWMAVHMTETDKTREVMIFRLEEDDSWTLILPETEEEQQDISWAILASFNYMNLVPPISLDEFDFSDSE